VWGQVSPVPLPPPERRRTVRTQRADAAGQVVGYLRVSTQEQANSGLGLDAQRTAIEAAATARGWVIAAWLVDEGVSGSVAPADRPAMREALTLLDSGEAGALVVAKLDRCSRDTHDFTGLLRKAKGEGWAFVALDLGVDTSTPVGRMVAEIMVAVGQWERDVIRQRTKDALAAKKAAGARLGRPIQTDSAVRQRIRDLRHSGLSLQAIADTLNAEGIQTVTGCAWTWHNVRRTVESLRLDDAARVAAS
jgi:DNA invertase Pin-like site-specific DNA recombinase